MRFPLAMRGSRRRVKFIENLSTGEWHSLEWQFIDEILESRPLATFSATHLELLEMLFAYWRETEVAEDAPVRASLPDPIQ